jgi:hypothetical protein
VRDGRLTVSGSLDARDNGGASFDEVVAGLAAVQSAVNVDYTTRLTATRTTNGDFVSSAANTGGLIIYGASLFEPSGSGYASLTVDGDIMMRVGDNNCVSLGTPFYVPSGQAVAFDRDSSNAAGAIIYEAL